MLYGGPVIWRKYEYPHLFWNRNTVVPSWVILKYTSPSFWVPRSWLYESTSSTSISAMLHALGIVVFLHPSSLLGLVRYSCFLGCFFFFSLRASILGVTDFISLQPVSLFILQRNAYFFFWVASCYLVSSSCEIWKHSSNLCPLIKKCVDFQWK